MRIFTDITAREWTIRIDANGLRRVQDLLGCNLADLRQIVELAQRIQTDDLFVVDVSWALCQPQAAERKLNREEFSAAMNGDCIGAAAAAIAEELPGFFRSPTTRQTVAAVVEEQALRTVAIQEKALLTCGQKSTPPPASLASTPEPTPTAPS